MCPTAQTDVIINKENAYRFLHMLLDMGEGLFCSGAEINRIEESILKIGNCYQVQEINVFVIPAIISITLRADDNFEITQTRRIKAKNISINLKKLEQLNDICHRCQNERFTLDELDDLINKSNQQVSFWRVMFGSMLAASSFTVLFGGTLIDALISACLAVVVCFFQCKVSSFIANRIIFTFICALIIGLASGLASSYLYSFNNDKVIIGNIMLIVPGISFTVSIRDIILEDTISGSLELIDSLFIAGGLSLGILVSFLLRGV